VVVGSPALSKCGFVVAEAVTSNVTHLACQPTAPKSDLRILRVKPSIHSTQKDRDPMSLKAALKSQAPSFVRATGIESIGAIIAYVRKWLVESDQMPSREEVLKCVDEFFDEQIAPMFKRKFLAAVANELLLLGVGELYDSVSSS
jgi:hypothetical protein